MKQNNPTIKITYNQDVFQLAVTRQFASTPSTCLASADSTNRAAELICFAFMADPAIEIIFTDVKESDAKLIMRLVAIETCQKGNYTVELAS